MPSLHNNDPVDMVEVARQTTRRDIERQFPGALKLVAPAKVNLYLNVGPAENGYHQVQNIMHTLMLHDVLHLRVRDAFDDRSIVAAGGDVQPLCPGFNMVVQCISSQGVEAPEVPTADNLAYKAVRTLAQICELSFEGEPRTLELRIEKNIPAQAGLAGGSSDAAAALLGAARLWGIDASDERVMRAAQQVGADVAFFLKGGCALWEGRGERFVKSYASRKDSVVLLMPDCGLSTAAVYQKLDQQREVAATTASATPAAPATPAAAPATPAFPASGPQEWESAADIQLFNSLEAPAFELLPELAQVRDWALAQEGAKAAMMTGSGSAVFVVCENPAASYDIAARAKLNGWWVRTTSFISLKASVVPQN